MNKRSDVRVIDLKDAINPIIELDGVSEVYLFGSRAYKTGSLRSDIDILVYAPEGLRADEVYPIMKNEKALDIFETVDLKNARSLANDSRLHKKDLVKTLDAVLIWSNESGFVEDNIGKYRNQKTLIDYDYKMSMFPTCSPAQNNFYRKFGYCSAFIIMPFDADLAPVNDIIKSVLDRNGIKAVRADDFEFEDDTWRNIKVYLDCCQWGVAVFDKSLRQIHNPNVALEVGYMMAMDKPVCLLKDKDLEKMPSDLLNKLYKVYDNSDLEKTISEALTKWISEHLQFSMIC